DRRGAAGSGLTRRIRRLRSPARGSAVEGRSRSMTTPPTVLNVAIIGTGVIGAAWASGFLAAGHSITAFDPAPGAEARLREQVKRNLVVMDSGQAPAADRLRFANSLAEAVTGADFVQENGPERSRHRPGERSRTPRGQAVAAGRDRRRGPQVRDHRLVDIGVRTLGDRRPGRLGARTH